MARHDKKNAVRRRTPVRNTAYGQPISPNLHIAPESAIFAPDRCGWTPPPERFVA
jgi:hypothetical protein